jgi:predicted dehydrogenase
MNHIEVQGTNGSLFTSILDYLPTTVFCREPRGVHALGQNFYEFPKTDVFERELSHFLDYVAGRVSDGIHSVADSRRLMEVIEAVLPAERELIRPYDRARLDVDLRIG